MDFPGLPPPTLIIVGLIIFLAALVKGVAGMAFPLTAVPLVANVVGPRQTHGVAYDFIRRLLQNPSRLEIWGDGTQSKSYVYIDDIVAALRLVQKKMKKGFFTFNVANFDSITVTQIARVALRVMGLRGVRFIYGKEKRGWKGDVPVVRLDSSKIRRWGWRSRTSTRQAIVSSAESLYQDALNGRLGWKGEKR